MPTIDRIVYIAYFLTQIQGALEQEVSRRRRADGERQRRRVRLRGRLCTHLEFNRSTFLHVLFIHCRHLMLICFVGNFARKTISRESSRRAFAQQSPEWQGAVNGGRRLRLSLE